MNPKKIEKFSYTGTYDSKKALRILAELYCKQEGYILEELVFASDAGQNIVTKTGE